MRQPGMSNMSGSYDNGVSPPLASTGQTNLPVRPARSSASARSGYTRPSYSLTRAPPGRRTRRHQRADAGHRRRPDQAGHGFGAELARREEVRELMQNVAKLDVAPIVDVYPSLHAERSTPPQLRYSAPAQRCTMALMSRRAALLLKFVFVQTNH